MNRGLQGLIGNNCFVYIDDIVIFGRTLEEHNKNLKILFERLRQYGLKLQPDKCEYLKPELEYLQGDHAVVDIAFGTTLYGGRSTHVV